MRIFCRAPGIPDRAKMVYSRSRDHSDGRDHSATGQKKPLDQLARRVHFRAHWNEKTRRTTLQKHSGQKFAPTEVNNQLRHRLVQGEVHDENAFSIGE